MENQYIGEHLAFGKAGQLLIILTFICSLLGAVSYFLAVRNNDLTWKRIARSAFVIHALAIFSVFGLLFYLIFNHYFEYYYVWHHSSTALPIKYILACFWEGQEGSFLLWMFWHAILSIIVIARGKEWEAPVMSVVLVVQAFLASMLLGVYIFNYRIGSDPFILLRNDPEMSNLPFIRMPDYLSKLKDGRGLNPLLQNYWMVIHPPTLFLGFASTLFPFAYAIAGLWTKRITAWIKPSLPWAFFGVMILGTGILMGGAWAYESLSFGGFWAWDPVENASLVPWLILVAAAHLMLVFKASKRSLFSCFLFTMLSFLLILYSTFLTRSGILGNTSVHAFTDLGMSGQLLLYMLFFVVLAILLLFKNRRNISLSKDEDELFSREFWMFIGTLVLLISAVQITFTTSIPVINKLFHVNLAPPVNPKDHYNKWQLPIAVILALLIGVTQFFNYKQTEPKKFIRKIAFCTFFALVFSGVGIWWLELYQFHYALLFTAGVFAVIANLDYLLWIVKGRIRFGGASIAHGGFGLILLGALISMGKSQIISHNNTNIDLGKDVPNAENILLTKGDTLTMGEYAVTYRSRHKEGVNIFYEIEYFKRDSSGNLKKQFSLKPVIQTNPRMGNVAEPDTKHFADKDVYTHITYADLSFMEQKDSDYTEPVTKTLKIGDTITTSNSLLIVEALDKKPIVKNISLEPGDLAVGVNLKLIDINKKEYHTEPVFIIHDNSIMPLETQVEDLGLRLAFANLHPETGKIDLVLAERKNNAKEFIVLKAIIFPYINFLWSGAVLMILGTIIAIRRRLVT